MVRDRFTWLAYLMLAYFAYQQAALGPLMPFLRDELHLSYTVGGLHFSAFAFGMMLAGLTADTFVRRWGRTPVFWGGGLGMAVGALLLIAGRQVGLTIFSAFLMGWPGTLLLAMIQATLSDRHGPQRATALTESNIGASFAAGMAPVLVGSLQRIGVGWRGALLVMVIFWVALVVFFRREPIPHPEDEPNPDRATPPTGERKRLPRIYWAYWLIVFLGVSVEWSIVFWGADFLENIVGLSRVNASTLMGVFFLAAVIGRTVASRLTRSMSIGSLLWSGLFVTVVGFVPFWLAPLAAVNIIGLFVAGMGVSSLYPLTLAAASSVVTPSQTDAASGRITLASGSAILVTPQVLGALADQIGIQSAYGIAGVLLVIAVGAVFYANRLAGWR